MLNFIYIREKLLDKTKEKFITKACKKASAETSISMITIYRFTHGNNINKFNLIKLAKYLNLDYNKLFNNSF